MQVQHAWVLLAILYCFVLGLIAWTTSATSCKSEMFLSNFQQGWTRDTDLIIVSAHYNEDLEWLKNSEYPVVICSKVGAIDHAINPNERCMMPNRGREPASYIKFILAFYDELPKRIAFVHGHDIAWHQSWDILSAIRCADKTKRFVSLNNTFRDDRNPKNEIFAQLSRTWSTHFEPHLKKDLPDRVFHDCCAQFIVTREAVHAIPRKSWEYWLDLLSSTHDDWGTAVQFEFIWHYIFGEEAVLPGDPKDYVKTHFTCVPTPAREIPPGPPI